MSYTDLRDFSAEYSVTVGTDTIELEKLGGGTVGQAYQGTWRYRIVAADGTVIHAGQHLHTGSPATHEEAMHTLATFLVADGETYASHDYGTIEPIDGWVFDHETAEWAYQNDSELAMLSLEDETE